MKTRPVTPQSMALCCSIPKTVAVVPILPFQIPYASMPISIFQWTFFGRRGRGGRVRMHPSCRKRQARAEAPSASDTYALARAAPGGPHPLPPISSSAARPDIYLLGTGPRILCAAASTAADPQPSDPDRAARSTPEYGSGAAPDKIAAAAARARFFPCSTLEFGRIAKVDEEGVRLLSWQRLLFYY
jgi:hypothetical protein